MFLRQRSDSLPIVTGRGLWTLTETTFEDEADLIVTLGDGMNEANGNCDSTTDANMESNPSNAALPENEAQAFTAPCRITFYHTRTRLADIDGLSGKAVIDGIVQAGILADDTSKQVKEVRHCQAKGNPEETKVVIEVVE